jgi:[ribosomal protein S5]-alanine N-acetyltransferase
MIEISTERLLIKPLSLADEEPMFRVFSDPCVMAYLPGGACDRAQSRARLQSAIEHQRIHGFSKWAMVVRRTGELIGDCGVR